MSTENPNTGTSNTATIEPPDLTQYDPTSQVIGQKILTDIEAYLVLAPTVTDKSFSAFETEVKSTWEDADVLKLKETIDELIKQYNTLITTEAKSRYEFFKSQQDTDSLNKLKVLNEGIKKGMDYIRSFNSDAYNALLPLVPKSSKPSSTESPNGTGVRRVRGFEFFDMGVKSENLSKLAQANKGVTIPEVQALFFAAQGAAQNPPVDVEDEPENWKDYVEFDLKGRTIQAKKIGTDFPKADDV